MVRAKKHKKPIRSRIPKTVPVIVPALPEKKRAGRKGYFQEWMIQDAQELIGKLGARNIDLAEYFEVDPSTIDYWIKNKPEFCRAVKRGRLEAALKVSQALYQRAIGCSHPDVHISNYKGEITVTNIVKHYPPDAYAAHKYLSIIFREVWADVNRLNIDHNYSGDINIHKIEELSMEDLSDEVKNFLFSLNMKQLSDAQNN